MAAAMWLSSGSKKEYKSFMAREMAKIKQQKKIYSGKVAKGVRAAIVAKYAKSRKLPPLPPAGSKGANKVIKDDPKTWPTYKQISKLAKANALKWKKAHTNVAKDVSAEFKRVESKSQLSNSTKKSVLDEP